MRKSFHIGKILSSAHLSNSDNAYFRNGNYSYVMDRIGKKHPSRLFIREWMKHRSLNGARLAERMETSEGTISKLLNEHMEMTTAWLARFADALDVSVPDLFIDPKTPTRDELLAAGTPEELRQAIRLVQLARTGTDG